MNMKFTRIAVDNLSKARASVLSTDHGEIETPIFMPVGTRATVKSIRQEDLKDPIKNYVRSNKYPPSDVDWGDLRSFSSNQNCISFASTSDL